MPVPHNFKSPNGGEVIQFSTAGGLAAQGKKIEDIDRKTHSNK